MKMINENSTSSFIPVEFTEELPVTLRVILVVTACIGSSLGNIVMLLIFSVSLEGKGSKRCKVIDIIIASISAASLCRSFMLGPIRALSFIQGEWSLGESMCQLQAYFEAMLRNVILWYLSLLSIERYTNHMVPHEYLVTFSPLTVNIILPGILLIVIVQVTGPLYGWGKYEYIEDIGLCGAATTSTFGCSYALYLLFSLTLPPFFVILINSILLSSVIFKKDKKTLSCGNSRMLNAGNELMSLIIFMMLFIILSIPRSFVDATIMCNGIHILDSSVIFAVYYLESLTDLILPITCLGMHEKSRKILYEVLIKNDGNDCDKQIPPVIQCS